MKMLVIQRTNEIRPVHNHDEAAMQKAIDEGGVLGEYLKITSGFKGCFKQVSSFCNFNNTMLGLMGTPERATLTNSLVYRGIVDRDWSVHYKLFNLAKWDPRDLTRNYVRNVLTSLPGDDAIVLLVDDTLCKKYGDKAFGVGYYHDGTAPKFLDSPIALGLRFSHYAILIPDYAGGRPLALPVGLELAEAEVKVPDAIVLSPDEVEYLNALNDERSLPQRARAFIKFFRKILDQLGAGHRPLIVVGDGSYTNGSLMQDLPDNTYYIGRLRQNAALYRSCTPTTFGPRSQKAGATHYRYSKKLTEKGAKEGSKKGSPEVVLDGDDFSTTEAKCFYASDLRDMSYKRVENVYWKDGSGPLKCSLLVVKPNPKGLEGCHAFTRSERSAWTQPSFLLSTAPSDYPVAELIQHYFDRWQIEVAHEEMKNRMGVGEMQAFSPQGVKRFHSAHALAYSALVLSGYRAFQKDIPAPILLPIWRRNSIPMRPTIGSIRACLRADMKRFRIFNTDHLAQYLPNGWPLNPWEAFPTAL